MAAPSPALAALLATAFPGAGQLYLGDSASAAATVAGEASFLAAALAAPPPSGDPRDGFRLGLRDLGVQLWAQAHAYTIYAAYRDARRLRDTSPAAATRPDNSLTDLVSAPFRPSVVFTPEVALPVASLVVASLGPALFGDRTLFRLDQVDVMGRGMSPGWALAAQSPVHVSLSLGAAVSEEALFRGMVQSGLLQWSSPAMAIGGQALLFGATHIPNAWLLGVPDPVYQASLQATITSVLGGWMGYLVYVDDGDLSRAVAFHFWYDALVMTVGFIAAPEAWPFRLAVALPF